MLFASISEGVGSFIAILILIVGFMRMGRILTGNKVLKDTAKQGLFSIIGRIFKR